MQTSFDHDQLSTDITSVIAAYEVAWNSRQAHTLTSLFTEDADLLLGVGPLVVGRQNIELRWQDRFCRLDKASRGWFSVDSARVLSANVVLINVHVVVSGQGVSTTESLEAWVLCREQSRWRINALRGVLVT